MSKPIVTRAVIVFSPRSIGAGDDAIFGLATPIGAIGSKSEPSVIQATRPRLNARGARIEVRFVLSIGDCGHARLVERFLAVGNEKRCVLGIGRTGSDQTVDR